MFLRLAAMQCNFNENVMKPDRMVDRMEEWNHLPFETNPLKSGKSGEKVVRMSTDFAETQYFEKLL